VIAAATFADAQARDSALRRNSPSARSMAVHASSMSIHADGTAAIVLAITLAHTHAAESIPPSVHKERTKMLVHVTQGPENPTRAALAFLVAKTAVDEGDAVTLFLAGDAVQLMRDGVLDNLSGLGTGKLRDLLDAIVKGGGRFYVSGMSSNARGITENDLKGKPAEFATPTVLLRLAREHDRMFIY
jgi:predicted peroxiredoxin